MDIDKVTPSEGEKCLWEVKYDNHQSVVALDSVRTSKALIISPTSGPALNGITVSHPSVICARIILISGFLVDFANSEKYASAVLDRRAGRLAVMNSLLSLFSFLLTEIQ